MLVCVLGTAAVNARDGIDDLGFVGSKVRDHLLLFHHEILHCQVLDDFKVSWDHYSFHLGSHGIAIHS